MLEQMRQDDQERRQALREGRAPPPGPSNEEGYWSSMTRGIQERTERLGIAGDTMERLEENSSSFASDVGKYVQNQKRKAVFGGKWPFLSAQQQYHTSPLHTWLTDLCSAGLQVRVLSFSVRAWTNAIYYLSRSTS